MEISNTIGSQKSPQTKPDADGSGATNVRQPTTHEGFNLLRSSWIRALVLWRGFPYVFQISALAIFVWLAVISWGVHTPAGVNAKLFAKSHLVTLVIWGLWWPAIVWTAVLLGRVWCMICPLELVSNVSERLGRRLRIPQRVLNRWISRGVIIVVLYALLQLLVAMFQLHRTPAYTSWFLAGMLALAVVTGLLWKDRAFCRGFCPVGLLLGTYGRGGMLAVRAGAPDVCQGCAGKNCVVASTRRRLDKRSCPSLLNPPKLNSSRDCLGCGQCIKACDSGNVQVLLRPWCSRSDSREPQAGWPVTLFVMLVFGFVTWELCTEWKRAEAAFLMAPQWLITQTGAGGVAAGLFKWAWALLVVPAAVWLTLAGLFRMIGDRRAIGEILQVMALPMAVVISAGHMSKGLAKFVTWAPFLPGALREPDGVATAQAITAKTLTMPAALLSPGIVSMICIGMVATAFFYSVREYRLAHSESPLRLRAVLPMTVAALLFLAIIAGWSGH
jgi:ferredoxin